MKKLFSIFAIAAALFAVSCSGPATPSDVATDVYDLFIDGKYEEVVDLFDIPSEDAEEVAEFKAMLVSLFKEKAAPQIEAKGGIASYEVVGETIAEDGKSAVVDLKFVYGNGEEEDQQLDLVLTDDGWKPSLNK